MPDMIAPSMLNRLNYMGEFPVNVSYHRQDCTATSASQQSFFFVV